MKKFILLFLISLVLSQIYDKDGRKPSGPSNPEKIKCIGGKVLKGKCYCPNGRPATNGVCRGSGPQVQCRGGMIKNGRCVCPKGTRLVKGNCVRRDNQN